MIDATLVKNDIFRNAGGTNALRFSLPSVAATGKLSSLFTATGTTAPLTVATNGASFQVGQHVVLTTTGTLPAPFALVTTYYVKTYVDAGGGTATVTLAATQGGAAIVTSTAGTGNHTMTTTAVSDTIRLGVLRPQGVIKHIRVASTAATQSTNFQIQLFTKSDVSVTSANYIFNQATINKTNQPTTVIELYYSNSDISTVIDEPPTNSYLYALVTNADAANHTGAIDLELVLEDC